MAALWSAAEAVASSSSWSFSWVASSSGAQWSSTWSSSCASPRRDAGDVHWAFSSSSRPPGRPLRRHQPQRVSRCESSSPDRRERKGCLQCRRISPQSAQLTDCFFTCGARTALFSAPIKSSNPPAYSRKLETLPPTNRTTNKTLINFISLSKCDS